MARTPTFCTPLASRRFRRGMLVHRIHQGYAGSRMLSFLYAGPIRCVLLGAEFESNGEFLFVRGPFLIREAVLMFDLQQKKR